VVSGGAALSLAACGSFGVSNDQAISGDASVDTQMIDVVEEHDAGGDADAGCSSFAACDGGEALVCPGLEDRCFFFCPERLTAEEAASRCREWNNGCFAGMTSPAHLECLKAK